MSSSSDSPRGRQQSSAKHWIITINNWKEEDLEELRSVCRASNSYSYQEEKGKDGTHHLQGYICYRTRIRLTAMKKLLTRAHLEIAKEPSIAYRYCMKEDSRVEGGPADHSGPPTEKTSGLMQTKWHEFQEFSKTNTWDDCVDHYPNLIDKEGAMRKIFEKKFEKNGDFAKETIVLWGCPGTGKTLYVRSLLQGCNYFRNTIKKWWDGYAYENTVWIDDYKEDHLPRNQLLQLMDPGPVQMELKGGTVMIVATRVIITSNQHPRDWFLKDEKNFREDYKGQAVLRRILAIEFTSDGLILPEIDPKTQRQGNTVLPEIVKKNFVELDSFFGIERDSQGLAHMVRDSETSDSSLTATETINFDDLEDVNNPLSDDDEYHDDDDDMSDWEFENIKGHKRLWRG